MTQFLGCLPPTPAEIDELDNTLASLHGSPYFDEVAPHLKNVGEGKRILLYEALDQFIPGALGEEAQTTGDCTSHAVRGAGDIARAVEIYVNGDAESFVARGATEPIYGMRGHTGQGMSIDRALKLVCDYGFLFRQKYNEVGLDLSKYNANIGINWGAKGTPAPVLELMKKHPFKFWTRCTSARQWCDGMTKGLCGVIGSGYMAGSTRDADGFAPVESLGGAGHAYMGCGFDFLHDRGLVFPMATSWGNRWIKGGQPKQYKLPPGGWLWTESQVDKAASGNFGGLYLVGDFQGPPPAKLENLGFKSWA